MRLTNIKPGRRVYTATVETFSFLRSQIFSGETVLLVDVRNSKGELVTDHVWQHKTDEWLTVSEGDRIKFSARIKKYTKAYREKDNTFSCVEISDSYSPDWEDVPDWDKKGA